MSGLQPLHEIFGLYSSCMLSRLIRRVSLVGQELLIRPEFITGSQWGSCNSIFSFMFMFCRSLFVLLYFFFWTLCCLFFFDLHILITPQVSSNSSCYLFFSNRCHLRTFCKIYFLKITEYLNVLRFSIVLTITQNIHSNHRSHISSYHLLYQFYLMKQQSIEIRSN